ncbi:MAG: thioredoxin family protein [candidate division Zixibacteria bacterium]|nr:thioredoxin family protein [candidate division Zixibacteria bacterium]
MKVIILGTGCVKCRMIESNIAKASDKCGIKIDIEKSRKASDYQKYKVGLTPAVIFDEKLIASGRIPTIDEFADLFKPQ